jgi:hypothetical protein
MLLVREMPTRQVDFSEKTKNRALEVAEGRCQRCWSASNLEFHHKVPAIHGGDNTFENCVVLCARCHAEAPSDPFVFENVFLRFSSPKDMIRHFNAKDEKDALEKLREEMGIEEYDVGLLFESMKGGVQRSDLIYAGMKKKAKTGRVGGYLPYGYNLENGELVINNMEAETVRLIFDLCLKDNSTSHIADHLNSTLARPRSGGQWCKQTVAGMLKNPTYCGFFKWDGTITKGSHAAIIRVAEFNRAQEKLIERIRQAPQKYHPTLLPEHQTEG